MVETNPRTLGTGYLGNAVFSFPASWVQEDTKKEFEIDAKCQSRAPSPQHRENCMKGRIAVWKRSSGGGHSACLLVHCLCVSEQRTDDVSVAGQKITFFLR